MSLPCSIGDLIPQKGKMSFEQRLIQAKKEDSQSTAIITDDNIFLGDNQDLSNIVLIEYVNQLVAAVQGYHRKHHQQPAQKGLFVGLQEAEFFRRVYLGDQLTFKAFVTEEVSQVTFIQGMIYRDQETIAQLVTKLYDLKDDMEFDKLIQHEQTIETKIGFQAKHEPPVYLSSHMSRKLYSYLHDIKQDYDSITLDIACPVDFEAFDGHFPGNPILPGIILLEIGKLAAELLLNKPLAIRSIKKMKINGVVLPNQVVSCAMRVDKHNGSNLSFSAVLKERDEREISRFSGYLDEGYGT